MRSMYYQTCTKQTDEGLVLASLLSAKPGAAANLFHNAKQIVLKDELNALTQSADSARQGPNANSIGQVDPEDRLRRLFLELDVVPVDILFADHPRYQQQHCHWIPTSLLSVNAPEAHLLRRSERLHRHTMLVRRRNNVVCRVTPNGLEIGLDGLRIQPRGRELKAPFRFVHDDGHFEVKLRESGTGREISATQAGDWVIIPETIFASAPLQCKGVLVKVTEWYPRRGGGQAEFQSLAVITRLGEEEVAASELPLVEVRRYEKTKASFKAAWKDVSNVSRHVLSESVHQDDKWVIG